MISVLVMRRYRAISDKIFLEGRTHTSDCEPANMNTFMMLLAGSPWIPGIVGSITIIAEKSHNR